jgi:branched-chain amino acid transport system substrate-binding protein
LSADKLLNTQVGIEGFLHKEKEMKKILASLLICCYVLSACQTAEPLPIATSAPTNTSLPPTATNTPFVPKATFKIAVHVPMTGDIGMFGTDIFHASELAVQQLSNPLELLGYDVELISYDDMGNVDTAVSNAKELVNNNDILCGVGHFNSRITIQATEIYHQAGLAFISPASTNTDVTKRGYLEVNRVIGRDDAQGAAGAMFAHERDFKAVYVLANNSAYGQKNADYFKRKAKELGVTIVGELFTDNQSNFESVIKRIISSNADLVYFAGFFEQTGNFIKEARALDYKGTILGSDGIAEASVLEFVGPQALSGGGVYYTNVGARLASLPNAQQFLQDYQAEFGSQPLAYAPYAYDATGICMKAIEEASMTKNGEVPTRADVANAIRSLVDYSGITGPYNFTSKGDPAMSTYQVIQITSMNAFKWDSNPAVATYEIEPPTK